MPRRAAVALAGLHVLALGKDVKMQMSQEPSETGVPYGHPDMSISYPTYEGFTLWVAEEFAAPLDLLSDPIWTYSDGGLGEGRVRYAKEGITFENGSMVITAQPAENVNFIQQDCSHAEAGPVSCKELISGEMRTRHNMFRYGRYESRIKAPTVQPGNVDINGSYVATMFTYRDGKFRNWREIDIEILGDGQIFTNVLKAENTTYYRADIAAGDSQLPPFNARADYHTYAFEWLPDSIKWFVDDVEIRNFTKSGNVSVSTLSQKILMSMWLWIDDGWIFGGPDGANNKYPLKVEYDWFRYYKWNMDSLYPCAGMTTDCLTEDDMYLSSNNPCDGIVQVGDDLRMACQTAVCTYNESANYSTETPELCATPPPPSPAPAPTPDSRAWDSAPCWIVWALIAFRLR